jgi:Chaperone of endosialidase
VKSIKSSAIVVGGLFVCAIGATTSVYAQQPPDVVTSGVGSNTAMGSGALANLNQTQPSHGSAPALFNTAAGSAALNADDLGSGNTAVGGSALSLNQDGNQNTAVGAFALSGNISDGANVAVGFGAMRFTTGSGNTATGNNALESSTGNNNSAFGDAALASNGSGTGNTALGASAMTGIGEGNMGSNNTATGAESLSSLSTGSGNTATGQDSLNANRTGSANVAVGVAALALTVSGSNNDALGLSALQTNISGSYNVAVGDHAGYYTTGNNNVDIANHGVAGENNVIRMGTVGTQKAAFLAGVYGTPLTGAAVVVTSTGQLGVVVSSERFKTDIAPIGDTTSKLERLRPVTFHLKSDPQGPLQYGLIAEEVAKVYPDLVIRDENGRIDGVRYDELTPMLLSEMQQQTGIVQQQTVEIEALKEQVQVVTQQATKIQQLEMQMAQMQELTRQMQASAPQPHSQQMLVAAK